LRTEHPSTSRLAHGDAVAYQARRTKIGVLRRQLVARHPRLQQQCSTEAGQAPGSLSLLLPASVAPLRVYHCRKSDDTPGLPRMTEGRSFCPGEELNFRSI